MNRVHIGNIIVLIFLSGGIYAQESTTTIKSKAFAVLDQKCNVCHTRQNPKRVFTPENMEGYAEKIHLQVFVKKRMPRGRQIVLTDEEKKNLMSWLKTFPGIQNK